MRHKMDTPEHHSDNFTYVSGLGFVPAGQPERGVAPDDIRRMSNLVCLFLLFYFLSQQIFRLPLTYLAYIMGFDVRINQLTGMIIQTPISETVIDFFTNLFALLIVLLLVLGIYHRPITEAHAFRKPLRGILPLAVPMTLSCGMLGVAFSFLFERVMQLLGLVFYTSPAPLHRLTSVFLCHVVTYLLLIVFQEIFFRGILLAPLRRFGDGFAIIASAMLYAVWTEGLVESVSAFIFGICAAYFVVRSGSVYTAVISRVLMAVLLFGLQILAGMVEQSLAAVVVMVVCLVIAALAILAYVRFVKLDPNAFRLVRPEGSLSTRMRLGAFCGSICFILLLVAMVFRAVNTVQIIG